MCRARTSAFGCSRSYSARSSSSVNVLSTGSRVAQLQSPFLVHERAEQRLEVDVRRAWCRATPPSPAGCSRPTGSQRRRRPRAAPGSASAARAARPHVDGQLVAGGAREHVRVRRHRLSHRVTGVSVTTPATRRQRDGPRHPTISLRNSGARGVVRARAKHCRKATGGIDPTPAAGRCLPHAPADPVLAVEAAPGARPFAASISSGRRSATVSAIERVERDGERVAMPCAATSDRG
jgi:hypothetical protein